MTNPQAALRRGCHGPPAEPPRQPGRDGAGTEARGVHPSCLPRAPNSQERGWIELVDRDDANARQLVVERPHVVLQVERRQPSVSQLSESAVPELDEPDDAHAPPVEEVTDLFEKVSVIADQEDVSITASELCQRALDRDVHHLLAGRTRKGDGSI